jgi:transposase InsO family protein
MPWKDTCPMDQKIKMIGDYLSHEYSITKLSELYEVSRKTIYKWVMRYEQEGTSGLTERPPVALRHPQETPLDISRAVVAVKLKHPNWGPKKLIALLERQHPTRQWPAVSTAGNILMCAGLVKRRKKKRRTPPYTEPFRECDRPNAVWSADYKGQFKTGDGRLCYPLTITDNHSRYLLCCRGLHHPSYEETKPWFAAVFKKYGLPEVIRTDNGEPFASTGLGGLSRLSVWFIKLGIVPERIRKGHPEENGRHERMHLSLKIDTVQSPKENQQEQQKVFDKFLPEFDFERPHEAIGMKTPASLYTPSLRPYPRKTPGITYHGDYIVRQVRHNGEIKWQGEFVYVSASLVGEPVALKRRLDQRWEIRFSDHILGVLDETTMKIISPSNPAPGSRIRGRKVVPKVPV